MTVFYALTVLKLKPRAPNQLLKKQKLPLSPLKLKLRKQKVCHKSYEIILLLLNFFTS